MTQKNFGCLGIVLAIVLCLSLLINLIFIIAGSASTSAGLVSGKAPHFEEQVVVDAKSGKDVKESEGKIALIPLRLAIERVTAANASPRRGCCIT